MDRTSKVSFESLPWSDEAPGIRSREDTVGGCRWAIVEYEAGAGRDEWCADGHHGFVLEGEIEYSFDDGHPPLKASMGEAFRLPAASAEGGAHRGRNPGSNPNRLFLIDNP